METYIFLAFIFFLGFAIGDFCATLRFSWKVQKLVKESKILLENIKKEEITYNVFELETEKVEDQLYLYTRDTKSFICQGKTLEELATLSLKYKNIDHAEVRHGNEFFMFDNGKSVKQYK